MKLLFSAVMLALVFTAPTAYAQNMKPAVAKCILVNLGKAHTDKAVTVLIRACLSLNK